MPANLTGLNGKMFDVVICGGGLAGLTLARQLRRALPQHSVLLVDRLSRPLPDASFKVGESTVELGAHYLGEKLNLSDYFATKQLLKMGLRYFIGSPEGPLQERPEYGLSVFPEVSSYQIDRGILENDLRAMNEADGVTLIEGASIKDVVLAKDGQPHRVELTNGDPSQVTTVEAKWVVDASGRRRLLQRKLGLERKGANACSAVWFRLEGRVDVDSLVPASETEWHGRVPDGNRYFSTNHLMNHGYWVWLIPLSSGNTSIGIVTADAIRPFAEYNTPELTKEWLRKNEPLFSAMIEGQPFLDFKCMHHYSYSSKQVYSTDRWACVGEAGVFADPLYSPGTDLIGFGNTMVTEMIRRDSEGVLTPELVGAYNQFVLGLNDSLTDNIQLGYPLFGHPVAMTAKLVWDNTAAWSFLCPQMFNSIFLDPFGKHAQIRAVTAPFFALTKRMQGLFKDWAMMSPGKLTYDFMDYLSIPYLYTLRLRNLKSGKEMPELVADHQQNMAIVEELAQVLFLLAVEDVLPEQMHRFPENTWLNAWRLSLNPDRWDADGLFKPSTAARDLRPIRNDVRSIFRMRTVEAEAACV